MGVERVIGHKEWAGAAQGKWDPGAIDMKIFRADILARLNIGDDELSAEDSRKISALYDAFIGTDGPSLSRLRKPGEGNIAPLTRFLKYLDANVHVPFMRMLAELEDPDAIKDLEDIAGIDLKRFGDRAKDAKLAAAILADAEERNIFMQKALSNAPVNATIANTTYTAPEVFAAPAIDTAFIAGLIRTAIEGLEPKVVYVEKQPETSGTIDPAGILSTEVSVTPETDGQKIGRAYDAILSLDISSDPSPENKAALAAMRGILDAKIGTVE